MEITFLGTSAGEEYPGIWCDCDNCSKARKLGGKNIRRNSSVTIDNDVMIDIGKTAHIQAERFGKNIRAIKTLLITHSHKDHLDLHTMWARHMALGYDTLVYEEQKNLSSPRFTSVPLLDVFGSRQVEEELKKEVNFNDASINFITVEPFQKYKADNLEIFTLDGNHPDKNIHSINYIIQRSGITFLYLSDSGWPFDTTLEKIKCFKFDFIITEGTFGFGNDSQGHMRLDKNIRLLEFFNKNNLWKSKAEYYLTHIAPHWCPPHDEYSPIVEKAGMKLAYDGLVLDIR